MKKFFAILPLFVLVFNMAGIAALAQEADSPGDGTRLSPHFVPGKIYTYVNKTEVTMTLPSADGGDSERKVVMEHGARLAASSRADGAPGTEVDASTVRFQFDITTPGRSMKYDSEDDSTKESPLGQHFEGARLRTVTLQLDETSRIVGSEEKGGGGPATTMPGMPQFGPDELRQLAYNLLQGFSPDPVRVGSEWTQKGKRSLGQFGELDFEITYRYTGDRMVDENDCAIIEFTGGMKGDMQVGKAGGAGKLGFEGTKLTGRLVFDKAQRMVRETSQSVNMSVEFPNPDPAAGGTIRVPILQEVTVKLVSLEDL